MAGEGSDEEGDEVTPSQARALAALITSATAKAAAKAAGVDVKTLRKWMSQPAFRRRHRAARNAVVDDAVLVVQKCAVEAATVLRACLKAASPGVRCRAAQLILGTAIEVQGLLDMAEDLDALNLKIDAIAAAKGDPDAGRGGPRGQEGGGRGREDLPAGHRGGPPQGGAAAGTPPATDERVQAVPRADGPAPEPVTCPPPGETPPSPGAPPVPAGGAFGDFSGVDLGTLFDDP